MTESDQSDESEGWSKVVLKALFSVLNSEILIVASQQAVEWHASFFVTSAGTIPIVSCCWEGLVSVATAATEIGRAERNSSHLIFEVLLWVATSIKI